MKKRYKIAALLVIAAILLFSGTGYSLVRPGTAENLKDYILAAGGDRRDEGSFYLVTISQHRASPVLIVYALLHPFVDLEQTRRLVPEDMDPEEYGKLMQQMMEESQNLAKVVALRRFGYDVPIASDGIRVVSVGEDSPAKGILFPGDIIRAVDGKPVFLAEELAGEVQLRPVGRTVTLGIVRQGLEMSVQISTTTHTELPDKAAIRIYIQTINWQPRFPVEIDIEVGDIGGPSAGLMFVLEIMNQLNPADLTAGRQIAGTGTINLREEVGAIGGVRQKVRAAENAGAEYFFVPAENYEEAVKARRQIELVPVATLDDALRFLENLGR